MTGTKRRPPPRSEIAEVYFDKVQEATRKQPEMHQFRLWAIGPKGIFKPAVSQPFVATAISTNRGWTFGDSEAAREAFNKMVEQAWNDGWQPVHLGYLWHQCTFRRVVDEE